MHTLCTAMNMCFSLETNFDIQVLTHFYFTHYRLASEPKKINNFKYIKMTCRQFKKKKRVAYSIFFLVCVVLYDKVRFDMIFII